jgi:hypothetical protein
VGKTVKKNAGKAPAYQRYPSDWLNDDKLRLAPFYAKGVWADLIELSYGMPIKGVFARLTAQLNGTGLDDICRKIYLEIGADLAAKSLRNQLEIEPFSERNLLEIMTGNEAEKRRGVAYIFDKQIIARTADGVFYVKRMYKDMRLRWIRQNSGKKGGNPFLVGDEVNDLVNQNLKQNPTPSVSVSTSVIDIDKELSISIPPTPQAKPPSAVDQFEAQFGQNYQPLLDDWRDARKSVGYRFVCDRQTQSGAVDLAQRIDAGEITLADAAKAMRNLMADKEARDKYTLKGLANNLSTWIVRGKNSDDKPASASANTGDQL